MFTLLSSSLLTPRSPGALEAAVAWMTGTLLGTVATTLCVLAIAFLGIMLLTGRFAIREGFRIVLGCFIVLGAPILAAAFSGAFQQMTPSDPALVPPVVAAEEPRGELPPADYDPYAGASLRRD
ncbi:MAG: TrbC/VirB2 family protein [Hyphomonas sp.]|uniref:TrbC/VirB2 family protein n=1 Tax=Hyphomonas sp. TaxID=87 RepID=UPI0032997318